MLLQNKSIFLGLQRKGIILNPLHIKTKELLSMCISRRNLWGRSSYPIIINLDTRWNEGLASCLGHFIPFEISFIWSDIKCNFLHRTWFWTVWQSFKEINIEMFWVIKKINTGYTKIKPIEVSLLRFIIPQMLNVYTYSSNVDSDSI